jgi:hypothetical protein
MSVATNIGGVVSAIQYTVNFGDTVDAIGTLPAGANILNIYMDVTTAFNGTGATISVGTSGTPTAFAAATSVTSAGRETIAFANNWIDYNNSFDTAVVATVGGTLGTAGSAVVTVVYLSQSIL